MKTWLGILAAVALTLMQTPAAFAKDEVLDSFNEQINLIDEISDSVGRDDLPALLAMRSMVNSVIEEVEQNRATGRKAVTFETIVRIQGLVLQYEFNRSLLGWEIPPALISIFTQEKADAILRLKTVAEQMKVEYGFDKSAYTKITHNTLMQIQKLLARIETLALDEKLKLQFRQMWVPIGKAAGKAERGDRPKAYKLAIPAIEKLRTMYPEFDKISASNAGFPVVMELKGLIEYYAQYSQQDEDED